MKQTERVQRNEEEEEEEEARREGKQTGRNILGERLLYCKPVG